MSLGITKNRWLKWQLQDAEVVELRLRLNEGTARSTANPVRKRSIITFLKSTKILEVNVVDDKEFKKMWEKRDTCCLVCQKPMKLVKEFQIRRFKNGRTQQRRKYMCDVCGERSTISLAIARKCPMCGQSMPTQTINSEILEGFK